MGQCITGPTEKTVRLGDTVTIDWDPPTSTSNLLYYRVRRSQTPSGSYSVWVKIPYDQTQYTFTVTETKSYHYFVSAWYSVVDAQGNTTIVESVGSNHARITYAP